LLATYRRQTTGTLTDRIKFTAENAAEAETRVRESLQKGAIHGVVEAL
jgi:hypothetical protein